MCCGVALPSAMLAQQPVSFPTEDGGLIHADVYGTGTHGVVLAHGGRFDKESWADQARALAAAGLRVVAIDFRGYGESGGPGQEDLYTAPLYLDVLAAVSYLRQTGANRVSVVGGSKGGSAAADAVAAALPNQIERLVLLGSDGGATPENLVGRKLFIVARNDTTASGVPRLVRIRQHYDQAPRPKELVVLDGAAHAQFLFQTEGSERVMRHIIRFLTAP